MTFWTFERMRTKVIIDTDPGVDDAQAIAITLANDHLVDVVAITTCHGNVDVKQVNVNVSRILEKMGKLEIPVYSGATCSLVGDRLSAGHYHGEDGLGDVPEDPSPADPKIETEHAVKALMRLVDENKGEITLLCIAPLTNVALAIRLDPDFGKKLKGCVIMGGNHQGVGNITPSAEFNFAADPEAAQAVLKGLNCQSTLLVTWELCKKYAFTWEWYDQFIRTDTPLGDFFRKIEAKTLATYYSVKDVPRPYTTCDQIAAAILVDPKVVTGSSDVTCDVETTGQLTRGQMVVDWENVERRRSNATLVDSIDVERYQSIFMTIVKGRYQDKDATITK